MASAAVQRSGSSAGQGQHRDQHGPVWFVVRDRDGLAAVTRNDAELSGGGGVGAIGVRPAWRGRGSPRPSSNQTAREVGPRGPPTPSPSTSTRGTRPAPSRGCERVGIRRVEAVGVALEKALGVSRLRARCPDCNTFTAVAVGPGTSVTSCGREFERGARARSARLGQRR